MSKRLSYSYRAYFEQSMLLETDDCIVWPFPLNRGGYGRLTVNGRRRHVHAVACEHAHGPAPEGMVAGHGPCHNRACINPRHVSWVTNSQNVGADKVRDGTINRGELNGRAKLTGREVREIRQQYVTGEWTYQQLADEFGVSPHHIGAILSRETWRFA